MIEPAKRVPKKYRKYAHLFPDKQLYEVHKQKYGLLFKCCNCKRWIPSMEEFIGLCFRVPGTDWSGKVCVALCKECAKH